MGPQGPFSFTSERGLLMECPETLEECINSICEFHGHCRKLPKPPVEDDESDEE